MSTLVQQPAPGFSAPTVMPDNTIREDFSSEELDGRYWILFFYPYDFSFVCPTELLALDARLGEFQKRDCEVVCVSVDSQFSHLAWKKTGEEDGGIGPVRFPMVSDLKKDISKAYGVLTEDGVSLRATFLVDRQGIVRHATVNEMDLGRSVQELIRTLDAVRHIDETGELCPADWDGTKKRGIVPAGIVKKVQSFDLGDS
ncbi:MAG: peroxiredoxin [Gemmatimonadetes bacterium]|nr:peroxiredoxin [Gemmatimonadota bacterium]NNM04718.1 peroxiredoxin [Gemmatimonadota bacterium]